LDDTAYRTFMMDARFVFVSAASTVTLSDALVFSSFAVFVPRFGLVLAYYQATSKRTEPIDSDQWHFFRRAD
jgi:hypothetical protein